MKDNVWILAEGSKDLISPYKGEWPGEGIQPAESFLVKLCSIHIGRELEGFLRNKNSFLILSQAASKSSMCWSEPAGFTIRDSHPEIDATSITSPMANPFFNPVNLEFKLKLNESTVADIQDIFPCRDTGHLKPVREPQ